ncbi:hypothetical protein [Streptomyces sp. CA-146814]|uniref:hypothetical protein n=1 Tax=Streptomyces sp. CA-146814 TaxID=3240053 RepID=UPI003D93BCF4
MGTRTVRVGRGSGGSWTRGARCRRSRTGAAGDGGAGRTLDIRWASLVEGGVTGPVPYRFELATTLLEHRAS